MGKINKNNIELDIAECFADDCENFWENFAQWKNDSFAGIYQAKEGRLPDVDANSIKLYEFHGKLWTLQREKFKKNNIDIPDVDIYEGKYLYLNDKKIKLSSDSFISIYWHYKDMQDVIEKVKNINEHQKALLKIEKINVSLKQKRKFDKENFKSDWKKFIWLYLQEANTIGGFIIFPRNSISINTRRGDRYGKIRDRFDLTLECIRRAYQDNDFYRNDVNPLFGIPEEEKAFFKMFGGKENGFKNYVDFFLLNSWIEEDEKHNYHVKNLLYNEGENEERNIQTLDNWNFNQNPLPQAEEWWTFYRNIMNRLDARNQQIKEIIEKSL